CTTLGVGGW
nr:immunoglobulin heavy chain junction region [Macaca mulatta]MOX92511.1 immunoglobulin heavy chain junction region [Macaca mulatta]MOX92829.1 immunoglobulin heavy chain junction region [Macaca mulatta]MOX93075.1 immunoglobulin heavy chain junction region [Macaca mulatta]MOX93470.1 immunoglobulin heavy chain junction region [Macaca mulatta]